MPFPLPEATGAQATPALMALRPLGAGLTAGEGALILAPPDHLLALRAEALQSTDCRGRQRQAMGGVVRLAVSAHQPREAPAQPAALGPGGGPPMVTDRGPMAAAMLLQAAHERPAIVAPPLPEGSRGIPRLTQDRVGVTRQALARRAEALACAGGL
jgi:hypothetical protein